MPHHPLIIAHRGFSARAPENTLAAFRLALEYQVDAIELDVHLSSDGQVIVIHDDTLDRTTHTPGIIASLPAARIQRANAAVHFPGHPFEPVPTLRQVLELVPSSTRLIIEIKKFAATLPVIRLLQETSRVPHAVIIAFLPPVLALVRQVEPALHTSLLLHKSLIENNPAENARHMLNLAREYGTSTLNLKYPLATLDTVHQIHASGGQVWVWTANTPQSMRAMLDARVDAITTDHPDQLRQLLR
jgi:glycerophosphoryl diester phosphodiesterase